MVSSQYTQLRSNVLLCELEPHFANSRNMTCSSASTATSVRTTPFQSRGSNSDLVVGLSELYSNMSNGPLARLVAHRAGQRK